MADLDLDTDLDLDDDVDIDYEVDIGDEFELEIEPDPQGKQSPLASYLNAKPPHLVGSRRTRYPRRGRGLRYRVAVPVLALLVGAGLALTSVIVGLVKVGLSWSSGDSTAASPLVVPAPAMAGGLPMSDPPAHITMVQQLVAEFVRRFTAASGSNSGQPTAFYREPGTVDLATNQPGWVMYLGYNSAASLGPPSLTTDRVVAALTGTSAPNSYWPAAPGPLGGSARCAIASFGTTPVSLCAWATEDTIGALMSPTADTRGNELAALMRLMRVDLQPGWPSRHLRTSLP